MSSKTKARKSKKSASVVPGPDRLLEEGAAMLEDRDDVREDERPDRSALMASETFEARNQSRLTLLACAMREFQDFMGDTPGYDGACSVAWDDDGEAAYVVEAQDYGVLLATANPAGQSALYLDKGALEAVVAAAQTVLAHIRVKEEEKRVEFVNALLEDAAQDREGCE